MDNIKEMEEDFILEELKNRIKELEIENTRLTIALEKSGLTEYLQDISDEECICVRQISRIKEDSDIRPLSKEEVQVFDLLNKNLKIIRDSRNKKSETLNTGYSLNELIDIAKN
jgi:hypothetical protein